MEYRSLVLQIPPAHSKNALQHYSDKLEFETDPSDVFNDINHNVASFILVDVRSKSHYEEEHIKGAVHIPYAQLTEKRLKNYNKETVFIVYCWSPACNGSTKAAKKIAELGFPVKEMIGGIEYWKKEGYPTNQL